jgi:carbon monoxide dehydrogenase subunit G
MRGAPVSFEGKCYLSALSPEAPSGGFECRTWRLSPPAGSVLTRWRRAPYEHDMKYSTEIEIDLPVARVVELFDNPDNMKHWMEGLVSFEPLSGTPGQPGARSRLRFKMGRRELEMVETITVRNLPQEFSGTYEANGVINKSTNRFLPIGDSKTRYVSEQEFDLTGFMKLMGWLMPGAFKKQSLKYQQSFKRFAESQRAP